MRTCFWRRPRPGLLYTSPYRWRLRRISPFIAGLHTNQTGCSSSAEAQAGAAIKCDRANAARADSLHAVAGWGGQMEAECSLARKIYTAVSPCSPTSGAHDVVSQHGVGRMDLGAHGARHLAVDQTVRVPGRAAHLARSVMRQQLRTRANASGRAMPARHAAPELCGDASLACSYAPCKGAEQRLLYRRLLGQQHAATA